MCSLLCSVASGLHRPVYLYSKPSAAAITDYCVKTPLQFVGSSRQLAAAHLQVQVDMEVAIDHQQQQQLVVTVDLCDSDGTVLLQDLPTKVEQVWWGRMARTSGEGHFSLFTFQRVGHSFAADVFCPGTSTNRSTSGCV